MTETLEGVSPNKPQATQKHSKSCPFCNGDEASDKNDLSHDADKLRRESHAADCLGTPEPSLLPTGIGWSISYVHPVNNSAGTTRVRSNPHHCIPARASLKGAYQAPLLEFIEKSKGTITADIGYDVNKAPNGIWLPTIPDAFYGGGGQVPSAGIKWGRLTELYPDEQFTMAEAAMYSAARQFHDAHPAYSEEVKKRLEKLRTQIAAYKMQCPEVGEKAKPNVPPPLGLVDKLNALSATLAQKLEGDPARWTSPYFTSRHSAEFGTKLRKAAIRQRLGL